jgi:hypothetical protein
MSEGQFGITGESLMINKSGLGIAASAALFALTSAAVTSTAFAATGDASVHCYGVNSCKGTSDCKTAKNECKGQNSCKGHGFKEMSAKECAAAGGKTTEAK